MTWWLPPPRTLTGDDAAAAGPPAARVPRRARPDHIGRSASLQVLETQLQPPGAYDDVKLAASSRHGRCSGNRASIGHHRRTGSGYGNAVRLPCHCWVRCIRRTGRRPAGPHRPARRCSVCAPRRLAAPSDIGTVRMRQLLVVLFSRDRRLLHRGAKRERCVDGKRCPSGSRRSIRSIS